METRLKVYADELHRRAMLSYSGANLQTNDKIISTSIYNNIGTYSNGNLTFGNDGLTRYIISAQRFDAKKKK